MTSLPVVDFVALESKVRQVVLQEARRREAFAAEREARRELLELAIDLIASEELDLARELRQGLDRVSRGEDREALELVASDLERRGSAVAAKVRAICTLARGA